MLGSLRSLRTLDLAFTRIGSAGAAAVAQLEHLRVLNLRCAALHAVPKDNCVCTKCVPWC